MENKYVMTNTENVTENIIENDQNIDTNNVEKEYIIFSKNELQLLEKEFGCSIILYEKCPDNLLFFCEILVNENKLSIEIEETSESICFSICENPYSLSHSKIVAVDGGGDFVVFMEIVEKYINKQYTVSVDDLCEMTTNEMFKIAKKWIVYKTKKVSVLTN